MEVVIARNAGQLAALREDWLALQRLAAPPSPFQEWRWVEAWQRRFGGGQAEPLVLVARAAEGPLAILPLQRTRVMGLSILTWLSAPALQYGGALLRPMRKDRREEALSALWRALTETGGDVLDLPLLPADGPLAAFLRRRCRRGAENAAYRIDLSRHANWREYELSLKPSARRSRKKRLNKLSRAGDLAFTVRPAGAANVPALERALEWKRGWLKAQGLEGALPLHAAFADLLRDLFAGGGSNGAGEWVVAELTLDGRPISVEAGAILHSAHYSWFAAYDPALSALSPGKAGLWLMLRWCMEHGIDTYDMLANPAPYKEDWANARRRLEHFVAPLSTAGRAHAVWLTQGKGLVRRVHGMLPPTLRAAVRSRLVRLLDG